MIYRENSSFLKDIPTEHIGTWAFCMAMFARGICRSIPISKWGPISQCLGGGVEMVAMVPPRKWSISPVQVSHLLAANEVGTSAAAIWWLDKWGSPYLMPCLIACNHPKWAKKNKITMELWMEKMRIKHGTLEFWASTIADTRSAGGLETGVITMGVLKKKTISSTGPGIWAAASFYNDAHVWTTWSCIQNVICSSSSWKGPRSVVSKPNCVWDMLAAKRTRLGCQSHCRLSVGACFQSQGLRNQGISSQKFQSEWMIGWFIPFISL